MMPQGELQSARHSTLLIVSEQLFITDFLYRGIIENASANLGARKGYPLGNHSGYRLRHVGLLRQLPQRLSHRTHYRFTLIPEVYPYRENYEYLRSSNSLQ